MEPHLFLGRRQLLFTLLVGDVHGDRRHGRAAAAPPWAVAPDVVGLGGAASTRLTRRPGARPRPTRAARMFSPPSTPPRRVAGRAVSTSTAPTGTPHPTPGRPRPSPWPARARRYRPWPDDVSTAATAQESPSAVDLPASWTFHRRSTPPTRPLGGARVPRPGFWLARGVPATAAVLPDLHVHETVTRRSFNRTRRGSTPPLPCLAPPLVPASTQGPLSPTALPLRCPRAPSSAGVVRQRRPSAASAASPCLGGRTVAAGEFGGSMLVGG